MATVRAVIRRGTSAGSRLRVTGSGSASTRRSPAPRTARWVPGKLIAHEMTSAPGVQAGHRDVEGGAAAVEADRERRAGVGGANAASNASW
jgi:hypothetical protein